MTITPHGHGFIDIHQRCQQAERQLQCRMISIEHDKQCGSYRASRHTPSRFRERLAKDTAERVSCILKSVDLLLATLRLKADFRANLGDLSVEHSINRLTIGLVEREVAHADKGRAAKPAIERIEYCRPLPLVCECLAIAFREAFRGRLTVEQQAP